MERGSPMPWPPRSLDITPLDFLWRCVKNNVFQSLLYSSDKLKSLITVTVQIVDPTMLHRTRLQILYKLEVLLTNNGAHIEIGQ
ncbi:uncharacterized protein TNCV_5129611 [Trichonephila clavipes]|nr:uncharacterized protein TNCV_5129611 [Trichonephila clavipes]